MPGQAPTDSAFDFRIDAQSGLPYPRSTSTADHGFSISSPSSDRPKRNAATNLGPPSQHGVHGEVIDLDAPLDQQLLDVAVGQIEAQIPADRDHDHLGGEPGSRQTPASAAATSESGSMTSPLKPASIMRTRHATEPGRPTDARFVLPPSVMIDAR
jgi:hypothetical protein